MTATLARQIVLSARPQGKSQLTDFRLEETEIPTRLPGSFCSRSSPSIRICAGGWMMGNHMPGRSRSAMS